MFRVHKVNRPDDATADAARDAILEALEILHPGLVFDAASIVARVSAGGPLDAKRVQSLVFVGAARDDEGNSTEVGTELLRSGGNAGYLIEVGRQVENRKRN